MAPNYMTPVGAKRLAAELRRLLSVERPRVVQEVADAAAQGDRSENAEYIYGKKRLRDIDRRARFLQGRLDGAVVVRSEETSREAAYFGAFVEIEDERGRRVRYQLVGPDEADPGCRRVSIESPIGRALLKRRVGDVVTIRRPVGALEVEIVRVDYGEDETSGSS